MNTDQFIVAICSVGGLYLLFCFICLAIRSRDDYLETGHVTGLDYGYFFRYRLKWWIVGLAASVAIVAFLKLGLLSFRTFAELGVLKAVPLALVELVAAVTAIALPMKAFILRHP